jgi:hypothetical protein
MPMDAGAAKPYSRGMRDLIRKAEEIYRRTLQARLEPAHDGEFVAIDPHTGAFFVASERLAAYRQAREQGSTEDVVLLRVGRPAPGIVGGRRTWTRSDSSATSSRS